MSTVPAYRYNQDEKIAKFVCEGGRIYVNNNPTTRVTMRLGYFFIRNECIRDTINNDKKSQEYNIGFDPSHPISLFGIRDEHLFRKVKPTRSPLKYEISDVTKEDAERYKFSKYNAEELLNALKVLYEVSKYYVACMKKANEKIVNSIREYFYSRFRCCYNNKELRRKIKPEMIDAVMEFVYGTSRLLLDVIENCVSVSFKREVEVWDVCPWVPASLLDFYFEKMGLKLKVQCKEVTRKGDVTNIFGAKDKAYVRCVDARALLYFMGVLKSGNVRVIKHDKHNRYDLSTWKVKPKGFLKKEDKYYYEPVIKIDIEKLVKVFWDLEVFIRRDNICRISDFINSKFRKEDKEWLTRLIGSTVKYQSFEILRAMDGFHVIEEGKAEGEKGLVEAFNFIDKVVSGRYDNKENNVSLRVKLKESEEIWQSIRKARNFVMEDYGFYLFPLEELLINFSVGHKSLRDFAVYLMNKGAEKFTDLLKCIQVGHYAKANVVLYGRDFLKKLKKEQNDKKVSELVKNIYSRRGEKVRHRINLSERNTPELLYLYIITSTRLPKIKKYSAYAKYVEYVRTSQWGMQYKWKGLKDFIEAEKIDEKILRKKFTFDELVELIDRVDEWKDGGNYLVNYKTLPDLFYVPPSRLKFSSYMKRFNAKAPLVSPIMAVASNGWYEVNVVYQLGNRIKLYYYDHAEKEEVDKTMKEVMENAGVKKPNVSDGSVNDVAYGLLKKYANRMFQFYGVLKCLTIITNSYAYIGELGTSKDCGLYLLRKYSEWLKKKNLSGIHNLNPFSRYFRQFLNELLDGYYSPFKIPDLFIAYRSSFDNGRVGRKTVNVIVTNYTIGKDLMNQLIDEWNIPLDVARALYTKVGHIVEIPKKLARKLEKLGHVYIIRDTKGENYKKAIEKAQEVRKIVEKHCKDWN